MVLAVGTRLGPYEIITPVGAGGMGEVYRAKDTRLDRTVAIKILPEHLSSNPGLKQRFDREARTISNLTHPYICALYDVGHQDGIDFLVMEFLEGETLAQRLNKGPLTTELLFRYSVQIADALDKAHRQGIVHRDLKPGNVMITKSGAKLLDFGLAKLCEKESEAHSTVVSQLATEDHLTEEGLIVGTVQYMAPEQLEGKEADSRTDIFALGEIMYEMATGQKAFKGQSKASLISAILTSNPNPISAVQPVTPLALDHVVKKCLAKDPDDRWQSASDLASELKWIAEENLQTAVTTTPGQRKRERLWMLIAFACLSLAAALALFRPPRLVSTSRPVKLSLMTPANRTLSDTIAVSPDGNLITYIAKSPDGKTSLWVRSLDSLDARELPGTNDAALPFWSPDSHFIGFFSQGKLRKIEVSGGPVQVICEVSSEPRGGTWNRDGAILFAPDPGHGLYRVSAAGGNPSPATTLDPSRNESTHRYPSFLPDGRHFLFWLRSGQQEKIGIYVGSLASNEKKLLVRADRLGMYSPPGFLLYVNAGTLFTQHFDADKLQVTGEAFPIAEEVLTDTNNGLAKFSVSETGVIAYRSGNLNGRIALLDRNGNKIGNVSAEEIYQGLALSSDNRRLAVGIGDPSDIWMLELPNGTRSRLTFGSSDDFGPILSPDGSRVVFASNQVGPYNLFQKASNGTGGERSLLHSDTMNVPTDWSYDGRFVAYDNLNLKTKTDLWVLPLFGDRKAIPFMETEANESQGAFSPDSRWIAYVSDESGQPEVYVHSFPLGEGGGKWQISTGGGIEPKWQHDGKELFYISADGKLMAVDIMADSAFKSGLPKPLFQTQISSDFASTVVGSDYVVTADGQKFLVLVPVEDTNSLPITVVLNWLALIPPH